MAQAEGPAAPRAERARNLGAALTLIAEAEGSGAGSTTRAAIASQAGLTRATAGSLVDSLIASGLVREEAAGATGRVGRRGTALRLDGAGAYVLGLEVNVDYLAVAVLDLAGRTVFTRFCPEDSRDRPWRSTLTRLTRLARQGLQAVPDPSRVAGATVAVPGLVDDDGGSVRWAPNLDWRDVPLAAALAQRQPFLGLPVEVVNEADAAARAELHRGGSRLESFIRVSGDVGVGAGIVLNGRPFRGTRGWGGEIGHLSVSPRGPACTCGSRGCLEQYAGHEAVLRAAGLAATEGPAGGSLPGIEHLVVRARERDRRVLAALERAGGAMGLVLAGVMNLLDIGLVILGGSHAALAPWLEPPLAAALRERVVWSEWAPPQVEVSALGQEAAVMGAADGVRGALLASPAGWPGGRTAQP